LFIVVSGFTGGNFDERDAAKREKYLKSAWGKRYIKTRLKNYLTNSSVEIEKHIP